ncbi:hypothetical protein D6D27_01240 [Aureobasidium pullulans]|nr:hypothetical protein D6D27_01240 [Aureobasidium pullulans]
MSPTPMETLIHNVDLDRSMSSNVDDDELWDATTPWDTQIEVPAQLIEDVDDNVKAHFPEDTEIKSIHPHGSSYWSRTAEIQTVVSGEPVSYFLKVSQNKFARKMFRGEYESQKAIYEVCPDFCPRPITWGVYQTVSDAYFFLSEFIDMVDELPDLHQYPQKVAQMHKKGLAPDGRYGFHVQDMCALLPMYVTKSDSWEDFFSKYMRHFMLAEKIGQGPASKELERLERIFFDRIIPRLCRPLETGGREIKPRLVHSDLWDGNSAIDAQTENPIIYDSSCFYGHNEYDLGVWRCPRHRAGTPYIEKYHEFFAKSAPEEDHEGRMLMYFLYVVQSNVLASGRGLLNRSFDTRASACWMGRDDFRTSMIDIMTELDRRFPETYEEWATARGEPVCPRKGSSVH